MSDDFFIIVSSRLPGMVFSKIVWLQSVQRPQLPRFSAPVDNSPVHIFAPGGCHESYPNTEAIWLWCAYYKKICPELLCENMILPFHTPPG